MLEGVNNRIKVIKRMAYGYRDTDHFFLKIRAAFPGDTRGTFFCPEKSARYLPHTGPVN